MCTIASMTIVITMEVILEDFGFAGSTIWLKLEFT
jgi:hypothetical protein